MPSANESEELNVRILRPLALYLEDERGEATLEIVCGRSGLSPDQLRTGSGWICHETFERFLTACREELGSMEAFAEASVYDIRRSYGVLLVVLSVLTARQAFETLARTMPMASRISRYEVEGASNRRLTLRYYTQRAESRLMCLTRRVQLPMVPTFVGLPRASLEEQSCVAWGDPCCTYRIRLHGQSRWTPVIVGTVLGALLAAVVPTTLVPLVVSLWVFPAVGLSSGAVIELRRRFIAQQRFVAETGAELRTSPAQDSSGGSWGASGERDSETPSSAVDRDAPTQTTPANSGPRPPRGGDAALRPGARIGRYELTERIGRGGMGTVFSARDTKLDRQVALKLLHGRPEDDDVGRARLVREGRALAALSHPNVVTVFDVGEWGDLVFLAMEFVVGSTLKGWSANHPRATQRERLEVLLQAADGLAAAHDAGLVHRDFKPSNILVGEDGRVRVADFGLARRAKTSKSLGTLVVPGREQPAPSSGSSGEAGHITATGLVAGTPRYMAPEQHEGKRLDPRCDQFSFCVVAYELLCGVHPFEAATPGEMYQAIKSAQLRPSRTDTSTAIVEVLAKGLSLNRQRRYASVRELSDHLRAADR